MTEIKTRMRQILAVALRQLYLIRGNYSRLFQLFIWVAVDMILWGFMTRYLSHIAAPGYNFTTALLGAVFLWNLLIRIMQGVTLAYMEDNWARNLFNIFVSPMPVGVYLCGLVLSSIMTSSIGIAIMLALAAGIFGMPVFAYGMALVPFVMILFLFGIALGITGCAMMMRLGPSAEWLVWPIPAVLSPFVGVFYPLATLPLWMQHVARFLPVSYVFENIRHIAGGGALSVPAMLTGLALAVAYIVAAALFFSAVFRRALKTGSIARAGAESF